MAKVNVFSKVDGRIDVSRAVGSDATAMFIYEVEPGRSSCPYHYEYEEEWLLVLDGTLAVRVPDGELRSSAATSSASRPGPRERTRS